MTEEEIKAKAKEFLHNPENIQEALALLCVGREKGHNPEEIMKRVLGNCILRFHNINLIRTGQN